MVEGGEGRGSLKWRLFQSLPCPAQLLGFSTVFFLLKALSGGEGGGGVGGWGWGKDPVFSGLHPRPSEQVSRPWPQLSKQLTELEPLDSKSSRHKAGSPRAGRLTSGVTCQVEEMQRERSKEGFSCSTPGERAGLLLPAALVDSLTDPLHRGEY